MTSEGRSSPWFHASSALNVGATLALDTSELRHATGAMRLRDGDAVVLFDGVGTTADAVLVERGSAARVTAVRRIDRPSPLVTLAAALPKGDRAATMIDMATQLGMAAFVPLRCERSVAQATPNGAARLARVALESCKQSRRAWLPSIEAEATPADAARSASLVGARSLLFQPGGTEMTSVVAASTQTRSAWLLIGPEGGFTDAEVTAVRAAGGTQVGLGDGILRIETAAVAAVALMCAQGW